MDEFIKKLDRDFSRLASAVVLGSSKNSIEKLEALRLRIQNIEDIAKKVEEAQKRRENDIDLESKLASEIFCKLNYMKENKPEGASFTSIDDLIDKHQNNLDYQDRIEYQEDCDYVDFSPKLFLDEEYDSRTPGPIEKTREKSPGSILAQPLSNYQDDTVEYVSEQEFQTVPTYMKGRMKVETINEFIEILNSVLNKKYDYLKQPKSKLRNTEKIYALYGKWKQQQLENKSHCFCTEEDFLELNNFKLSKKENNIIAVLRHLKRMRQIRIKNCTYYVIST